MVLTGWTAQELRRQPVDVIRGLMWRVYAAAMHSLAQPLRDMVGVRPTRDSFGSFADYLKAADAYSLATKELAALDADLFPEDGDV